MHSWSVSAERKKEGQMLGFRGVGSGGITKA